MQEVLEERIGNYKVVVSVDENAESPREWDNLGTMVCFHRRYDLGDNHEYDHNDYCDWYEMKQAIIKKEKVHTILPLYLYDHGGISISTSPFSCKWDSGQVGWIFTSNEDVKNYGVEESKVEEILVSEVETYDNFLKGEVYRYHIYNISKCDLGHEHETLVDSCSGFYSYEECFAEANTMAKHFIKYDEELEYKSNP